MSDKKLVIGNIQVLGELHQNLSLANPLNTNRIYMIFFFCFTAYTCIYIMYHAQSPLIIITVTHGILLIKCHLLKQMDVQISCIIKILKVQKSLHISKQTQLRHL